MGEAKLPCGQTCKVQIYVWAAQGARGGYLITGEIQQAEVGCSSMSTCMSQTQTNTSDIQ